MRLGRRLRTSAAYVRDILVDPLVERHDTADGAHGQVRSRQEAPDAELAGVGVALLEVVHRHYHRKPHLPRPLRATLAGDEAGEMLRLEARDPPIYRRTRDLQI